MFIRIKLSALLHTQIYKILQFIEWHMIHFENFDSKNTSYK